MKKTLLRLSIIGISISGLVSFSLAQENMKTRSITSADFESQRPAGKRVTPPRKTNNQKKNNPISKRITYKYVRQDKNFVRRKTSQPKLQDTNIPNANKPAKISELGVTIWKLRPSRSSDRGQKIPVLVNNQRQMWTAERVNIDNLFQEGDRLRLGIESGTAGYLYVFNSETYSDGSVGDPNLIFPYSINQDNSVRPGLLVDIPDQREDVPYFNIEPKKANYTGELLTVIVSPKPLTIIKEDGKIKNLDDLIELENTSDAEIYSRTDRGDKIYTQAEASSTCGAKTRELVREKTGQNPCGEKTRELTRQEPLPQTIYRIKAQAGHPSVAFIKLNARR